MYEKKEYICGKVTFVEKHRKGNYGAPGKKREKRNAPTPQEVMEQNDRNRRKRLERIVNTNFGPGDIHLTLTYAKEQRPDPAEAKKCLDRFIGILGRRYKKHVEEFKWIKVTEYRNKAIHHHLLINCPDSWDPSKDISSIWTRGRPKQTRLDDSGDYTQLADYLIKETEKTFREEDNPSRLAYSTSRNLKKPKVLKKDLPSGRWKRIPTPRKGYYIIPDSIIEGVNPVTGYEYQYYTMVRLPEDKRRRAGKKVRDG